MLVQIQRIIDDIINIIVIPGEKLWRLKNYKYYCYIYYL